MNRRFGTVLIAVGVTGLVLLGVYTVRSSDPTDQWWWIGGAVLGVAVFAPIVYYTRRR